MKSDASKTLKQIQRVIQSLEERKQEIIQDQFAVPLMEIVSIARDNEISLELISYAMRQKEPRVRKSTPRKSRRSISEPTDAAEKTQ